MDTTTMLTSATYLLAIAAAGGIIMALMRLGGVPRPPLLFAMGHGLLAAAGLTLVLGAALGGASLHVLYHSKGLTLPIPFILGHGLVAAPALALLWLGAGRPLPF
jgi:hypothetical protein